MCCLHESEIQSFWRPHVHVVRGPARCHAGAGHHGSDQLRLISILRGVYNLPENTSIGATVWLGPDYKYQSTPYYLNDH
jgi:hypothetical protein